MIDFTGFYLRCCFNDLLLILAPPMYLAFEKGLSFTKVIRNASNNVASTTKCC